MALRAGYYGLKNSVKRTLEKLASDMAGAKVIKTVGDGLSLSDQGVLAANIDTETMEFKNHKLAAKVSSAYTIDELWDYEVEGQGSVTYDTYTLTLRHTIDDYDEILVELISNAIDTSGDWSSSVQARFNVEALENARVPHSTTYCSFGVRSTKYVINGTTFQAERSHSTDQERVNGVVKIYGIKY